MRTSELAERAAVNPQTLRYYERVGLLAVPGRTPGGYRDYPEDAVAWVSFIKRAQRVGFHLSEIETLLHLGDHASGCGAARGAGRAQAGRRHPADRRARVDARRTDGTGAAAVTGLPARTVAPSSMS